jgi:CBS domain-containing protein
MYEVRDAMSDRVISIRPDTTVEEAIRALVKHNISGAPVVDDEGALVGVISEFQLLEVTYDPELKQATIADFMTRDVIAVSPNTLLTTAANLFVVHRIRRVPVLEEGRLVGILSRRDILRYVIQSGQPIREFFTELRQFVGDTWGAPMAKA